MQVIDAIAHLSRLTQDIPLKPRGDDRLPLIAERHALLLSLHKLLMETALPHAIHSNGVKWADAKGQMDELYSAAAALGWAGDPAQWESDLASYGETLARVHAAWGPVKMMLADTDKPNPLADETEAPLIELVPAGFRLAGGPVEEMTGKPLAVLRALYGATGWRLTAEQIISDVWPDEDAVSYPQQALKDAASALRQALREAIRRRGKIPGNPLPSRGKGADLTYRLDLSMLQKL
jgi:hypothetical protein